MKVDMSPEAIDARLTLSSELLKLCLSLGKAQPAATQTAEKTDTLDTSKRNEPNHK